MKMESTSSLNGQGSARYLNILGFHNRQFIERYAYTHFFIDIFDYNYKNKQFVI